MEWLKQSREKLLLGQLLVKQKLISEEQLARAIAHQRTTGQRLGDILAEWNLLTQRHVQQALRKQRKLRLAAATAAALFAPLEALAAMPAPAIQASAQAGEIDSHRGMRALSEQDLGEISAQGLTDDLLHPNNGKADNSGVTTLARLVTVMNPLFDLLDADGSIKDLNFDAGHSKAVLNGDGSVTLTMAASIGELRFDHIRVHGDTSGASFGSILFTNIDFSGTTLTLAPLRH